MPVQPNPPSSTASGPSSESSPPAIDLGGVDGDTIGPLRIYNYYRLAIGVGLVLAFVNDTTHSLLGAHNETLFAVTATLYVGANVALAAATFLMGPAVEHLGQRGVFALVAADVLALIVLMFASGGITSGLAPLTLVAIGAGAILLAGRVTLVPPALATIAVLYAEALRDFASDHEAPEYFQSGILGALYFATALVLSGLAVRLRRSQSESEARAQEVADLERLSDTVIQRMRTGILVVDPRGGVRMANGAARQLLRAGDSQSEHELPQPLRDQLIAWRDDASSRGQPFQLAQAGPDLRANFSAIRPGNDSDTIVFLEDHSEVQQQAQQLKLAGLGRLSASIAHEIRNPLGAISHAAQLLAESAQLDDADRRLADIIQNHCRRMNGIIANVLELSRRRAPSLERIDLDEWLVAFLAEYAESHPGGGAPALALGAPDTSVQFDTGQLHQVLTNLVDNARRYGQGNVGSVRIASGIDELTERPYLTVIDDGNGVPPERVAQLFEPFFTTEAKGTGLGLYLSRELCEANQARLSYFPASPRGSCFRVAFAHPKRVMS